MECLCQGEQGERPAALSALTCAGVGIILKHAMLEPLGESDVKVSRQEASERMV